MPPARTFQGMTTCPACCRAPRVDPDLAQALQALPSPPSSHSRSILLPVPQENSPPRAAPLRSHSQSASRLPSTRRSQWSSGQWSSAPATPLLGHMLPRPIIGHCSESVADESHREVSSKRHQPERRPSVQNSSEFTSRNAKRDQRSSVISSGFSSSTRFSAELVRRRQNFHADARSSSAILADKVAPRWEKQKVSSATASAAIPRRRNMQHSSLGIAASAAVLAEKINKWSAKIEVCHLNHMPDRTSELEEEYDVKAKSKVIQLQAGLLVFGLLIQVVLEMWRTVGRILVVLVTSCFSLQPPWLFEEERGRRKDEEDSAVFSLSQFPSSDVLPSQHSCRPQDVNFSS